MFCRKNNIKLDIELSSLLMAAPMSIEVSWMVRFYWEDVYHCQRYLHFKLQIA